MPKGRLLAIYILLGLATAAILAVVAAAGEDKQAMQSIAGGYDASGPDACLGAPPAPSPGPALPATAPTQPPAGGPAFDVKQSGRFVNVSNAAGTLGGRLELAEKADARGARRLTGDVTCVNGRTQKLDATVTTGTRIAIEGTLGGRSLSAELKRDPPDPGTPKPRAPSSVAGPYKLSPRSTCFGGAFELEKAGAGYSLHARDEDRGELRYDKKTGALSGDPECVRGGAVRFNAVAVDRNLNNVTLIPLDEAEPAAGATGGRAVLSTPSGLGPAGERFTATRQRESFGHLIAAFFIAIAVVMLVARLFGILAVKLGQPRVMGEVVAGICLGPTVFGAIAPGAQATLFSTDFLPAFGLAANLGLIFYMFLIGLELDRSQLKGRVAQAAVISNVSVLFPMILGIVVALPIYELVAPDKRFLAFAIFMGVSMSITAFPVLARILAERRMLTRPIGAIAITCAAIDDVTAWFLIALATAIAVAGTASDVVETIALAIAFCLVMGLAVRPLLGRVSAAYDEAGRVPGGWVAAIFAGVLLSAFVTEEIGIAVIFGGFIMGMIMPRNAGLTEDVTRRMEDFVVTLLLPLFFAYTGLRTNIGLLDRPELWLLTGVLIAVAIIGKLFGAMIAARLSGFDWRESSVIGTLMNTRGLTELIVLNLALEKGVISDALFAALVIMALVTTFMAGPMLRLLDPNNRYGAPVQDELEEARRDASAAFPTIAPPERSILIAPQTEGGLRQLRTLAEPLARSEPPRELIVAELVRPPHSAEFRAGLQTENKLLREANERVTAARSELVERGIAARAVAFTSTNPGEDLAKLATSEEVDLILMDGRRPLLGEGVPRGDVGVVLQEAPGDVAVLVARDDQEVEPDPARGIVVPFGGAEHDWAALELGAWLASATGVPIRLLGAGGQTDEGASATRTLASANLVLQQFAGITAEPLVAEPGREGVLAAARDASLLVIGLSDRWRQEGLGPTRSEIARAAPAPVLFVRRGTRPGALAPREDVTRFTWSSPGAAWKPGQPLT
jgi:Kef-type K+ transport system membrane component KefB/nucleotide-binding universal stress UspA family protein